MRGSPRAAPLRISLDEIQGNILNGYKFKYARFYFLASHSSAEARALLAEMLPRIQFAELWPRHRPSDRAVNLAVSFTGLRRLGVAEAVLEGFPEAFRIGPGDPDRAADLGDIGCSAPENWEPGFGTRAVHFLASVYGLTEETLNHECEDMRAVFARCGAKVLAVHEAMLLDGKREHFGFADGSAQPDIEGAPPPPGRLRNLGGGVPVPGGGWRPVRLGEFVLGYPDEDGDVATRPLPELTSNGSYLVYRKLYQDVARFREAIAAAARCSGLAPELVAAKIVGRWRDGIPLTLDPDREVAADLTHEAFRDPPNDFRYLPDDRDGARCPLGAHIRRVNPRDGLDFGGAVRDGGRLTARHRIVRRGMPYGAELEADESDDGQDRGLLFLCYNAYLERQFETVQAQWCNDGDAFGLGNDRDYILGAAGDSGKMTIPVRHRRPRYISRPADLVITRGAEYLFVPSCSALAGLAANAFRDRRGQRL